MWFRSHRDELEARLEYRFRDPGLLAAALVHRSWANDQGVPEHNERLEFLGDAVLGLIAADWLYRRYPERPEGDLARLKAWLVSEPALARHATTLGIGERLRLAAGEERSGGREKSSLLADALEAVFAAVWLDGGLEAVRPVVERFLETTESASEAEGSDAKTRLQELAQAAGWPLPVYAVVSESGPDHDRTFVCEVALCGERAGRGEGRTKKDAQQRAAAAALE
ncbi:MAG: ribonuclease III, partial [Thermoanaerobaculia bacterium]